MTAITRTLRSHRTESRSGVKVRLASVDAYRGFVMLLMFAELIRSCAVASVVPQSRFWSVACDQQTHAAWLGASLHDLIQPSFYFLVGVGLLFSVARRRSSGQTGGSMATHAIFRSLMLVVLGMAVVAIHPRQWTWVFTDTLTQIGLAYPFLFLIALRPKRDWGIAFGAILVSYWLWFALSPLAPPWFDFDKAGVPPEWLRAHGLPGFAAHWQKNGNVAAAFDRWLLNLFPRDAAFTGDVAGLTTLNFIPSIGTMILGLFAGSVLRSQRPSWTKVTWFSVLGISMVSTGWLLGVIGVCPVVKAIWTPSWVLYSGGWCFLLLAGFYAVVDLAGFTRAAFPLIVIGMNSIVAYVLAHVYPALAFNSMRRVVGSAPFQVFGGAYEPAVYGAAVVVAYWLALFLLYRQRMFVRI